MTPPNGLAGRLRHRLTLQQEVETPDGAGGYVRSWEDVAALWAEIVPLTGNGISARGFGREYPFADQLQSEISCRITLRYRGNITAAMRLVFESRAFNIRAIVNVNERKGVLVLFVQEGVAT